MLRKLIREKFYCGLDIGAHGVKAALVKAVDPHCVDLLGVYETKTRGYQDASVTNLAELTECIYKTIHGLSGKTGVKLKDLYVGVGGDLIETRISTTVIPLLDRGSKVIGPHDVRKINNQARLLGIKVEEEILHDFPQYYKVDDVNTALNPLGLYGRKLEVNSLLVFANMTRMRNITKAVNQAGYETSNLFFAAYAAASVSLAEKNLEEGCILIDVGSSTTDVLIFKNGCLKFLDRIHLGGYHVTHCIVQKLGLPFNLAEDIKKSYAIAIDGDSKNEEDILVKRNASYIPIKRQDIYQAIKPEIDRLVVAVKDSLYVSRMTEEANEGIVMVGGGALLSGLLERISDETNLPIKMGKVRLGSKSLSHAPIFSSAVGLAKMGVDQSAGLMNHVKGKYHLATGMLDRVKELYQEYF